MSYTYLCFHCVFGTKNRRGLIRPEIESRLWCYLGGIARENHIQPLGIGGVADHVHLLLSMPASLPVAKAMQLIKGGSSKWVHDTFPDLQDFAWQKKYGAFSVSASQVDHVLSYVRTQKDHHRKMSFAEEFINLLERHQIAYDEKFLWD